MMPLCCVYSPAGPVAWSSLNFAPLEAFVCTWLWLVQSYSLCLWNYMDFIQKLCNNKVYTDEPLKKIERDM